jgi:hypothetical protein
MRRKVSTETRNFPLHQMAFTTTMLLCSALLFTLAFAQVKVMPLGDSTTAIVGYLPSYLSCYAEVFVM